MVRDALRVPHPEGWKALSRPILILRHRRSARAERALHHHGVEPAAEFEADIRMRPDHLEAARGVHADRSGIGGIADHGDHLAVAAALAFLDQAMQQPQADAAAMARGPE